MNARTLNTWAEGTVVALERQQQGVGRGLTPQQRIKDLMDERQRLQDDLQDAQRQIADLQRQLEAYRVAAGHEPLVTQTEAARRLGVHPGTVSRWLAAGHFQTYTGAGKKPLLYASSLHRPTRRTRGKGRRKDQGHS